MLSKAPVRWTWGGLLVIGGGLELYTLLNEESGDTLTEVTQAIFRTDTMAGRIVFSALWSVFAIWFLIHILGRKRGN